MAVWPAGAPVSKTMVEGSQLHPCFLCSRIFVVLDLGATGEAGRDSHEAPMVGFGDPSVWTDRSGSRHHQHGAVSLPHIVSAFDLRDGGLSCWMGMPRRNFFPSGDSGLDDSFVDAARPDHISTSDSRFQDSHIPADDHWNPGLPGGQYHPAAVRPAGGGGGMQRRSVTVLAYHLDRHLRVPGRNDHQSPGSAGPDRGSDLGSGQRIADHRHRPRGGILGPGGRAGDSAPAFWMAHLCKLTGPYFPFSSLVAELSGERTSIR